MGSGFPLRPSRNTFGPKMVNAGDVIRTDTDVDETMINLIMWQAAGGSVAGGLAWEVVSSAGARTGGGEAWNPNADPTLRPACAKTGTGVYTLTFETLYPDEDGQSKALQIVGALATPQTTTANITAVCSVALVSGQWVVTVKTATGASAAAVDCAFLVQVF